MIDISLDHSVKRCYCCNRTHMKRTIKLTYKKIKLNLGVTCAGRWFGCDMSGNINLSVDRLKRTVASIPESALSNTLSDIINNASEYTLEDE